MIEFVADLMQDVSSNQIFEAILFVRNGRSQCSPHYPVRADCRLSGLEHKTFVAAERLYFIELPFRLIFFIRQNPSCRIVVSEPNPRKHGSSTRYLLSRSKFMPSGTYEWRPKQAERTNQPRSLFCTIPYRCHYSKS